MLAKFAITVAVVAFDKESVLGLAVGGTHLTPARLSLLGLLQEGVRMHDKLPHDLEAIGALQHCLSMALVNYHRHVEFIQGC